MTTETYINQRAKTLGLHTPFTKEELDKAFRTLAFKYHPDVGGSAEMFIAVKKAYDELTPLVSTFEVTKDRTYEGQLLSELGKGLGDLINSKDCPNCHAQGYISTLNIDSVHFDEVCPNCNGEGYVWVDRLPNRFLAWFVREWGFMERCTRCQGRGGFGKHEDTHVVNHTCYYCNGTGQIVVPNPALPKNRVFANVPNVDCRKKKYCQCGALIRGNKCWRCDK